MTAPKVLVVAPTSKAKDYCAEDWLLRIKNLSYTNYDIFIVDNSYDSSYIQKFKDLGINCQYVNPEGSAREYILKSQTLIREYFLSKDYDYLFFVESDIIPPLDIVEKLMIHEKPVCAAPYLTFKREATKSILSENDVIGDGFAMSRMLSPAEAFLFTDGDLKQTTAAGFGCVLIERWVIEKIPFRIDLSRDTHTDSMFYEDLLYEKIPAYFDSSIWVDHINSDWSVNSDNV